MTRDEQSLWPRLSDVAKSSVKNDLLACVKNEEKRDIKHKLCDCVADLGSGIVEENGWPELLPFMFQCLQSGDPKLMESSLLIFQELARYVMPVFVSYLGTLHDAFGSALSHADPDVRLAGFKAATTFISGLEDPTQRDQFQTLVPFLLQAIGSALNAGDEEDAQEAVELLIEIADEHPRFLRKQLPDVATAMLQISETDSLDPGTRRLAAEFLVTLCEAREKAPGMMRKLPNFVERLFKCLISFLLDIEDVEAWHKSEDEKDESEGEGELSGFGQECLDRIAISLGGKTLVPVAGVALPGLLGDQTDWRKRHAALICLAQIAEGCMKVMMEETMMQQLTELCLQGCRDPHAKVRWAACQAIGQLCNDLSPDYQETQHASLIPALATLMDDFSNPRVQAHACAAMVNFAESCDQDVMQPYLDGLISKLLQLLQSGRRNVQEGSLTALASIAECSQDYFIKYYDTCMPLLRHILEFASDRTHWLMRAKALECISLVGMAVGKERFASDADAVMRYIQAVQQQGLDPDDPFASYMLQAGARVCTALGADFIPYLPVVMPHLLQSAKLEPDVVVQDVDEINNVDEGDEEDVETFLVGNKRISLHTSVLEEKANACTMLCCYSYELREGFYQYVEEVTNIMVPLLKFYYNEEVRSAAAQTLPELLRSAVQAWRKGMGPDENFCRSMLDYMWQPLIEAVERETEPEIVNTLLMSVEELVDVAEGPTLLKEDRLPPAFKAFETVLNDYEERRADRLERATGEDFDQEEQEALEEEHEAEGELLDSLGNCLTTIMKLYKDSAMPLVETIMPSMGRLMENGRFIEERRVALCLMDDVISYSDMGANKYLNQVVPLLLAGASDPSPVIRQCCVYGLGAAAEHRPDAFRQSSQAALQTLMAIIQADDARSDDNVLATENAVSAVGKILEFLPDCAPPGTGLAYIQSLPIEEDETEAKVVHAQLLRFVRNSDKRILGDNNENLPKVVEVFVRALSSGDKLVELDVAKDMSVLLQQMQGMLPKELFDSFVSNLKPKQQEILKAALEGKAPVLLPSSNSNFIESRSIADSRK